MKKKFHLFSCLLLLAVILPLRVEAQTVFFTDNFTSGSTTNKPSVPGGTPTASSTSYDIASSKTGYGVLSPGDFTLKLSSATTSGYLEAQAVFTTNPVVLTAVNDYVDITVVFTNTGGTLLAGGIKSLISLGLYNSGGSLPVSGGLLASAGLTTTAGSAYATGNCANWQGYVAEICNAGTTSKTMTRPLQNGSGTTSANQELLGPGGSGGTYSNPAGTAIETAPTTTFTFTAGAQYTLELRLTLTGANILTISNNLYSGVGTGGTVVFSQGSTNISGSTFLTGGFDGLSIGAFNSGTSLNPTMDITSIAIIGQSTVISTPPTITAQPVGVQVPNGAACDFSVAATGFNVTYQWYRYGTNLLNGGNISGANSSQLVISPAGTADVASGANGYYVVVSGAGDYSTNSVTNSLALVTATNLVWSGSGTVWDLNTSVSWTDPNNNSSTFNFGDQVTFNDAAVLKVVTLTGNYLSASSVTVDSENGNTYTFQGNGSFAGPGSLNYTGPGQLTINNANTYSGGTIISNASAYLYLENYGGLGNGPVTLAKAGGEMEIVPSGGATSGINGGVDVADDFTILFDGSGSYAGVFLGDLSGTSGKTLTFNQSGSTTNRYRLYGADTVYNANLVVNGTATSQANYNGTVLAPYNASGSQTYNGVISGNTGLIQRGTGTTILNGANTYSGGTTPSTGAIGFGIDSVGNNPVSSGPIGTGSLYLVPEVPSVTGSGVVFASGGAHTVANPLQYPSGTNNLTLIVGGTNALTFSGAFTLNGLDNTGTQTSRTIQVTNTALTTISGVISDNSAGYSLIKAGNGTLLLNNTETYTGSTTVSNGTLWISGQLAGSGVTVLTNAILGGAGTITSPVSVQSGGTLAPGTASIGTLTINNSLTLAGNAFFRLNKSGSPLNDAVTVSGAVSKTGTGTLTVTNLGSALAAGDKFTLFSQPVANGSALTVTGGGVNWTNNLAVDGSISVLSITSLNPTNITFSVIGGNTLALSWPVDHLGWTLQVQTNSLATGLNPASNAWVNVSGSTSVNATNITINPAAGAVFYRLVYP